MKADATAGERCGIRKTGKKRLWNSRLVASKKSEDSFDTGWHFSVKMRRFYCWHCTSVGVIKAKLNL
jgi:hypothetical protein